MNLRQVQNIRLFEMFLGAVMAGLMGPAVVKLQGISFTTGELSLLMALPVVAGLFQVAIGRLERNTLIKSVLWIEVTFLVIGPAVWIAGVKPVLVFLMVSRGIFGLLYFARGVVLLEIAEEIEPGELERFSNLRVSVMSAGAITGFGVSYVLSQYIGMTPMSVILLVMLTGSYAILTVFITNQYFIPHTTEDPRP